MLNAKTRWANDTLFFRCRVCRSFHSKNHQFFSMLWSKRWCYVNCKNSFLLAFTEWRRKEKILLFCNQFCLLLSAWKKTFPVFFFRCVFIEKLFMHRREAELFWSLLGQNKSFSQNFLHFQTRYRNELNV